MSSKNSPIDNIDFKENLRQRFISLVESERGLQSKLANSIGKKSNLFAEIKRGKPVNALHLKAVGEVCGSQKVAELLSIDDIRPPSADLDIDILSGTIKGLEDYLKKANAELESGQKARLISLLYDHFIKTGEEPNQKTIVSYLKLVA